MNERIREFADQCEGRTICECGEVGFNFEKFAELLVRECADISEVSFHNGSAGYLAILNHFGVTE